MRLEDTGKASDNVRLSITVTSRDDKTHNYLYRRVMRYSIDERDDGNVYIHFNVDPSDRMHEAVRVLNNSDELAVALTGWLLTRNPALLEKAEETSAESVAALCNVIALIASAVMMRMPEHAPEIKDAIMAKLDRAIDKNVELFLARALRGGR